mgnify:CR=1 FL=1
MSWTELNKIIKKYRRAKVYDVKGLDASSREYLDDHYKAPSKVQYGTNKELEALADAFAFIDENIRRKEWESYTREDWAKLEYEYVERAHYTKEDLFDDVLTKYERGLFTAEEAQAYTKQFRECKYRFCLNVFKPKRKNNEYCPGSDCARREANAKIRFKKTGTYLPPSVYKDNRNDTDEDNYKENEIAFNLGEAGNEDHEESNEQVINKIYQSHQRHLKGAGKRDENRDMYDYINYDEKDAENIEESPVIVHQNPVYNRRAM